MPSSPAALAKANKANYVTVQQQQNVQQQMTAGGAGKPSAQVLQKYNRKPNWNSEYEKKLALSQQGIHLVLSWSALLYAVDRA